MGNDMVIMCKYTTGSEWAIQHYYNYGKSSQIFDSKDPSIGLSNAKVSYVNGILNCSFNRISWIENNKNYFDLRKEAYVLVATGSDSNSSLLLS
jgi:hypothetical protein